VARRAAWIRYLLTALLTAALLAWFLYGLDFGELGVHLLSVRPFPLFLCLFFTLAHFPLRALRWRALLHGVGRAPYRDLLETVLIGYAVNNTIPGRIGEVARPVLLARRAALPIPATLATVLLERIIDATTVLLFFLLSLPFLLPRIAGETGRAALRQGLTALGILCVLALAAFLTFRVAPGPVRAAGRWALRLVPHSWRERVEGMTRSFLSGFGSLGGWKPFLRVVVGSLVIWLDIALSAYFGVTAFGIPFSIAGACFLTGWLAVGISLPTPAGVGGYHKAGQACLYHAFRLDLEMSAGIAVVLHAVSVVPVTLIGLLLLRREGGRLADLRAAAEASSDGPSGDRLGAAEGPAPSDS
jgi:uncharacterized protein (TIRG00374 family)